MLSEYTGSGAGKGYTVNVAWHTPPRDDKTTDLGCNEYRLAWEEVLEPIAREFAPDIIMISCGLGFCITRPPGHHAHADHNHGFCFFNNVALAAQLAANKGNKVLIFDWDIH